MTTGMPEEVLLASLGLSSQTINTSSFHGCIRNLYINHELQDFTRGHMKPGVVPGCQACHKLYCVHGICRPDGAQVTSVNRAGCVRTFTLSLFCQFWNFFILKLEPCVVHRAPSVTVIQAGWDYTVISRRQPPSLEQRVSPWQLVSAHVQAAS